VHDPVVPFAHHGVGPAGHGAELPATSRDAVQLDLDERRAAHEPVDGDGRHGGAVLAEDLTAHRRGIRIVGQPRGRDVLDDVHHVLGLQARVGEHGEQLGVRHPRLLGHGATHDVLAYFWIEHTRTLPRIPGRATLGDAEAEREAAVRKPGVDLRLDGGERHVVNSS